MAELHTTILTELSDVKVELRRLRTALLMDQLDQMLWMMGVCTVAIVVFVMLLYVRR